jgi:hypothetical protein
MEMSSDQMTWQQERDFETAAASLTNGQSRSFPLAGVSDGAANDAGEVAKQQRQQRATALDSSSDLDRFSPTISTAEYFGDLLQ